MVISTQILGRMASYHQPRIMIDLWLKMLKSTITGVFHRFKTYMLINNITENCILDSFKHSSLEEK